MNTHEAMRTLTGIEQVERDRDDWKQRTLDAEEAQRALQRQFDELRVCRESVLLAQEVAQLKEDLEKEKQRAEAAEKAAAEMREAFGKGQRFIQHTVKCAFTAKMEACDCGMWEVATLFGKCLESTASTGYLSPGEVKEAVKPVVEALNMCWNLIAHAKPNAFENGVKDSSGTIDEGEVIAGQIYEQAKEALAYAKEKGWV